MPKLLKSPRLNQSSKLAMTVGMCGILLLWFVSAWLMLALVTYSPSDPGMSWSSTSTETVITNFGGRIGALVADVGRTVFGFTIFLLPVVMAIAGWFWLRTLLRNESTRNYVIILFSVGIVLTLLSGSGLENLHATYQSQNHIGGIAGYEVSRLLESYLDTQYATALLIVIFVVGSTFCNLIPWLRIFSTTGKSIFAFFGLFVGGVSRRSKLPREKSPEKRAEKSKSRSISKSAASSFFGKDAENAGAHKTKQAPKTKTPTRRTSSSLGQRKEPVIVPIDTSGSRPKPAQKPRSNPNQKASQRVEPQVEASLVPPDADFPDTSILDPTETSAYAYSQEEIVEMGERIESMLSEFNVEVTVRNAQPGPVITQFEIEPAAGVKAIQIVNLANDLARTLAVQSVRVVDKVPGTSFVGLEVPNKLRETVRLVDGLESEAYKESDHPLTIVLGKDIRGQTVVANLAAMPHLLIAGTTGAGKSVCLNAILLSFLFKSSPDQLRLIMVDPKMLEFSVYEGVPHLLAPVITDMNKTNNALHWCISEMERRFALMAGLGVRSMENYNDHIKKARLPVLDPTVPDPENAEPLKLFPYIVLVIDELSDLIMVMGKKAEELIIRIAQRARAAGIHLIVATQRPSTDVIRGVLKANIPTRIAFRVASNADSRTILDQTGAEHLLGKGDMLFIPPGSSTLKRVHGAFVSDDEVKRVVDHLKRDSEPSYDDNVTESLEGEVGAPGIFSNGSEAVDEMYEQALDVVSRSKTTSISKIQRELRIGYNRAARIIDSMESEGVVSSPQSGGVRNVLISNPDN